MKNLAQKILGLRSGRFKLSSTLKIYITFLRLRKKYINRL